MRARISFDPIKLCQTSYLPMVELAGVDYNSYTSNCEGTLQEADTKNSDGKPTEVKGSGIKS